MFHFKHIVIFVAVVFVFGTGRLLAIGPIIDALAQAQIYMDDVFVEVYADADSTTPLETYDPYPGSYAQETDLYAGAYSSPSNTFDDDVDLGNNWTSLRDAYAGVNSGSPDFAEANAEATAGATDMVAHASMGVPAFSGEYNTSRATAYRYTYDQASAAIPDSGRWIRLVVPYTLIVVSEPSLIDDDFAYTYVETAISILPVSGNPINFYYYDSFELDGIDPAGFYDYDNYFDIEFRVHASETFSIELYAEGYVGTFAETLPWDAPDVFGSGFEGDDSRLEPLPEPAAGVMLLTMSLLTVRRQRSRSAK